MNSTRLTGASPVTSRKGTAIRGMAAMAIGPCLSVNRIRSRPPVMPHIELPNDSQPVPLVLKCMLRRIVGPQLVRK